LVEVEDSDDESEEMSIISGYVFLLLKRIFGVFGTCVYLIWVNCDLKASL
jgi:hypothetical protein